MIRFLRKLWARLFGNDYARALLLKLVARDAALLVIAMNPRATWAELLAAVIQQMLSSGDPPTTNATAVQRAAVAALIEAGKTP